MRAGAPAMLSAAGTAAGVAPVRGLLPLIDAAGPLQRVHDFPAGADRLKSDAIGIEAVIVNGTLLRQGGEDQVDPEGALPGQLLRHGHASEVKQAAE